MRPLGPGAVSHHASIAGELLIVLLEYIGTIACGVYIYIYSWCEDKAASSSLYSYYALGNLTGQL